MEELSSEDDEGSGVIAAMALFGGIIVVTAVIGRYLKMFYDRIHERRKYPKLKLKPVSSLYFVEENE